ncbi:stress protein [Pseudomonas fluorescens]|uniref:Dabb family protein n=1 Tax=Pseudomonas TaxID=286 RepID=UPI0005DC8BA3|nr:MULTISPECIES: Dabb family protein [Pseudomonas]KJH88485.1 stress protein [Pseudomonas fluorescens]TFF51162.1 Dabb family protein [Pseudomonas putida]TFF53696.1 Dabb family protein [Pseudomonas putida]
MMRHIVMFRRLPGVDAQPEREADLVDRMRDLTQEIDFIRDWRVAANELDRPICWDYILEASFDDADAVQRYLPHPAHQALVADLKQYFEWVAVDYSV